MQHDLSHKVICTIYSALTSQNEMCKLTGVATNY